MDTPERPRRLFLRSGLAFAALGVARAQLGSTEVLKAEYEQNLKDSRTLADLAKSIELDLEKNDQNVLSLDLLKKLDEIDKITKRIRGRVKK